MRGKQDLKIIFWPQKGCQRVLVRALGLFLMGKSALNQAAKGFFWGAKIGILCAQKKSRDRILCLTLQNLKFDTSAWIFTSFGIFWRWNFLDKFAPIFYWKHLKHTSYCIFVWLLSCLVHSSSALSGWLVPNIVIANLFSQWVSIDKRRHGLTWVR